MLWNILAGFIIAAVTYKSTYWWAYKRGSIAVYNMTVPMLREANEALGRQNAYILTQKEIITQQHDLLIASVHPEWKEPPSTTPN